MAPSSLGVTTPTPTAISLVNPLCQRTWPMRSRLPLENTIAWQSRTTAPWQLGATTPKARPAPRQTWLALYQSPAAQRTVLLSKPMARRRLGRQSQQPVRRSPLADQHRGSCCRRLPFPGAGGRRHLCPPPAQLGLDPQTIQCPIPNLEPAELRR